MFNNIIYFIIVLLIFNISTPKGSPESPPGQTLTMFVLTWLIFAGYCRIGFLRLLSRHVKGGYPDGQMAGEYQRLVMKLSIVAILLFAIDVHIFQIRTWLQALPGLKQFSVLEGLAAVTLFILYLCTPSPSLFSISVPYGISPIPPIVSPISPG